MTRDEKTDSLQKEMWAFIENIQKNSKIEYADCVTIFFLRKITDLQTQVEELSKNNH